MAANNNSSQIHEDIVTYIEFMESKGAWYGDAKNDSIYRKLKRTYCNAKCVLFFLEVVGIMIGLSRTEGFGIYDGTFIYLPTAIMKAGLTAIVTFKGAQQQKLCDALNDCLNAHSDQWMSTLKDKCVTPVKKFVRFFVFQQNIISYLYLLGPFISDSVLHYIFDYLDSPLFLPGPWTPWIESGSSWDVKYYVIYALNFWSMLELVSTLQWIICGYAIITAYYLAELIIFKQQVNDLKFEVGNEDDDQFRQLISRHNNLIRLNQDLKAYLGLLCAALSLFISFALTLCSFTALTRSDNIAVVLTYCAGLLIYLSAGLVFNTLGQRLENEGEDIFGALYNLRWYRYRPQARKNLNMMIRQARSPLTIDYHGQYKMNLQNFQEILRSSYSYFTLLQSMTSKS